MKVSGTCWMCHLRWYEKNDCRLEAWRSQPSGSAANDESIEPEFKSHMIFSFVLFSPHLQKRLLALWRILESLFHWQGLLPITRNNLIKSPNVIPGMVLIYREQDETRKKDLESKFKTETFPAFLKNMEKLLALRGGEHFAGNEVRCRESQSDLMI